MYEKRAIGKIDDQAVYDLIQSVPSGKVCTYGDIATALGYPKASRVVGRILGRNPNPIVVPCHRVIMSNGKLGGYADSPERKKELLEREGIAFSNDSVSDFEKVRFSLSRQKRVEAIKTENRIDN